MARVISTNSPTFTAHLQFGAAKILWRNIIAEHNEHSVTNSSPTKFDPFNYVGAGEPFLLGALTRAHFKCLSSTIILAVNPNNDTHTPTNRITTLRLYQITDFHLCLTQHLNIGVLVALCEWRHVVKALPPHHVTSAYPAETLCVYRDDDTVQRVTRSIAPKFYEITDFHATTSIACLCTRSVLPDAENNTITKADPST